VTGSTAVATCVVCGSAPRHGDRADGVLRRCGSCSFVWTAGAIAPPEEIHDEAYFHGGGYEDYLVPSARRFEADQPVRWLRSFVRPTTLVEAGCAAGFFVAAARAAGYEAQGVEVSAAAVTYARDTLRVPVRRAAFESATQETPVGVVCAFHVLEHAEDPGAFLDAARRALEPGGVLALEVPNIASAAARRLGPAWSALQPAYHRWHFDPTSLTRLVTGAGFDVIRHDTTVFRFYMPPRYRRRHAHRLLPADARHLRSLRLTHPARGDLLRLVARRPADTGAGS
jgi:SAM-dependent methyltransferase